MKNKKQSTYGRGHGQRSHPKAQWPAENSQEEKRRMSTLRKSLLLQFPPTTEFQGIALELVLHCWRRCHFFIRREKEVIRTLSKPVSEMDDGATSASDAEMHSLYGADRRALRDGIKLLSWCKDNVDESGKIPKELGELLAKRFGEGFVAILSQWTPPSRDAALLAHFLVEHATQFRRPLPRVGKDECQAVLDPTQCHEMVRKLLELKIQDLEELLHLFDVKVGARASGFGSYSNVAGDTSFREAMRDLQGAVAWLKWLKRNGV